MFKKLEKNAVHKTLDTILDTFKQSEEDINNLNVFPVPDGDTGTNMLLTLKSIHEEVHNLNDFNVKNISETISFGALMGARGNSGVILSQIFKGFFDRIMEREDLDLNALNEALALATEMAYSSVQNPTEGTMLTTIKDISQLVEEMVNGHSQQVELAALMDRIIEETEKSVTRTTYLLPVLKQADVVDAGSKGLLVILQGLKIAFQELGFMQETLAVGEKKEKVPNRGEKKHDSRTIESSRRNTDNQNVSSDIKYTYCTELIVKGEDINVDRLKDTMEGYGDSAMVVGSPKLVKIHVHTNHPHKVLQRSLREGTLHDIQINNMVEQSQQAKIGEKPVEEKKPEKPCIVAVANGDGLTQIFKSIGVDHVIKGGQTMNPSTYDMVKTMNEIQADHIIILPNNKNIIPTAKQAKRIVKKNLSVVPTQTIVQGIAALLNYNPDSALDENLHNMDEAIHSIKSGEVTAAVRDANLVVGEIKKGQYIGLYDGKVKVISDNVIDATLDLVRDMVEGDEEVVTFYAGKDSKKEEKEQIKERIEKYFPDLDIEFQNGGQPLYPYIFSIE